MNQLYHILMSHVTHMNESCHTYEWVISHIRMNHVTHMDQSCHTYDWVMSHMHELCHTYEWAISQKWMGHFTYERGTSHMNASRQIWIRHVIYEWSMSHMNEAYQIWIRRVTYMNLIPPPFYKFKWREIHSRRWWLSRMPLIFIHDYCSLVWILFSSFRPRGLNGGRIFINFALKYIALKFISR